MQCRTARADSPGSKPPYVHPSALCDSQDVGVGTRIWAFAQVMNGATLGTDCNICGHAFIESGARVGHRVTIKNGVLIWDGVVLEDDVFVGPGAIFTNDRYPRSPRMEIVADRYAQRSNWLAPTLVRQGATIGAGATIICGITIGRYACVAAGAVVTRSVAAHRLVLGNPARPAGWVCRCGRPLDDRLVCPECARSYVLEGGELLAVE